MEISKNSDIREVLESTAKAISSRMTEIHGPLWSFRVEFIKHLVTLCSAILVGTITFSGALLKPQSNIGVHSPYLLIISWSVILLSILSGLVCMWLHIHLLGFRPRFFNSSPELEKRISDLIVNSKPSLHDFESQLGDTILKKILNPIGKADRWINRILLSSLVLFFAGLSIFIIFGAIQYR